MRIFKNNINENELLLICARIKLDDKSLHQTEELINSGLDWDYIVEKACRYGIILLLYHNLREVDENGAIPQNVMNKLGEAYQNSIYYNMRLYDELSKGLKAFKEAGIEVIVLKGAALGEAVYQNIALRPMKDIDLLIKKEDLPQTANILLQMGYHPTKAGNVSPEWYYKYSSNIHYIKESLPKTEIDLHWNLVRPSMLFPIKINDIWERAQKIKIGNENALTLSAEDMIIHLCFHYSFHHTFNRGLRSFCDIAATIRTNKPKINWQNLLSYAIEAKLEHCIYGTLFLTKKIIGIEIPADFLHQLRSNCRKKFIYWVEQKTKEDLIYPNSQNVETVIRLLLLKRNADKLRYFNFLFFPSIDQLALRNSFSPTSKIDYLFNLLSLQKKHFLKLCNKLVH